MKTRRATLAIVSSLALAACTADTAEPEAERSSSDVTTVTTATPITTVPEGTDIPAGRYQVPFEGLEVEVASAEVDVPRGFHVYNGSVLWADDDRPHRGLLFWTVTGVNPDPCRGEPPLEFTDPGPSVEDLATALARQPHRRGPGPRPVGLAGYDGLYLELRLPDQLDPDDCETGFYEAWQAVDPETNAVQGRYQYGPGSVDRLWILDVDGHRVVVDATYDPRITESDAAALDAMVDSIEIRTGGE